MSSTVYILNTQVEFMANTVISMFIFTLNTPHTHNMPNITLTAYSTNANIDRNVRDFFHLVGKVPASVQ